MTEFERRKIQEYRGQGTGYKAIAAALGLSRDSVRGFCRRSVGEQAKGIAIDDVVEAAKDDRRCPCCGSEIANKKRGRSRRFCSEECRRKWWNDHPEVRRKKEAATYAYTCPYCSKAFSAYGDKKRKYCSHDCYIKARFWRGAEHASEKSASVSVN